MKKYLKLLALIIAVVLIVGIACFANNLMGNPISKFLAVQNAKAYLSDTFPGTDYRIDRTVYNFKDGNYHNFILSESSRDTQFVVIVDMLGNTKYDTFDSVTSKEMTMRRLEEEYRTLTDSVLNSAAFPYESNIAFGTLIIYSRKAIEDPMVKDIPSYSLVQEDLILDKEYDICALGAKAGRLVIYVDETVITVSRAAEIMLDITRRMDEASIPFYAMDFHLTEPLPEEGPRSDVRIDISDFLYEDIYADGLEERITEAIRSETEKEHEK